MTTRDVFACHTRSGELYDRWSGYYPWCFAGYPPRSDHLPHRTQRIRQIYTSQAHTLIAHTHEMTHTPSRGSDDGICATIYCDEASFATECRWFFGYLWCEGRGARLTDARVSAMRHTPSSTPWTLWMTTPARTTGTSSRAWSWFGADGRTHRMTGHHCSGGFLC